MSKKYTEKELDEIMKENKIIPYEIYTLKHYNELAEEALKLKDTNDIISALWFANITDSLYEFEFKNPEHFDFDKEDDKDTFYLGQRVKFNYKIKTNNGKEKD